MEAFDRIWETARPAFAQRRTERRARKLALSALACLGRRTITGMICTAGEQFVDWSADYRLFERERFDPNVIFASVLAEACRQTDPHAPVWAMLDDTNLRKSGRKVYGAKWRLDRLGPKFNTNLIWAQRFLQISVAVPQASGASQARAIPVDLQHCPQPAKPKPGSQCMAHYKQAMRQNALTVRATERLATLRYQVDKTTPGRPIVCSVDGGYTNKTVLRDLPENTTMIGRIRKDAKLFAVPEAASTGRGRPAAYGEQLPTPEQMRQECSTWSQVEAYAGGKVHQFQVKSMRVRWRAAGPCDLKLLIIRPLSYRRSKTSKLLYREPTYLITTDPDLADNVILQNYMWRWEIEVNIRDEKQVTGIGDAHVRSPASTQLVPSLIVAAYAILHLACNQASDAKAILVAPKWIRAKATTRLSSNKAISLLRADLWRTALGISNFSDFAPEHHPKTKPQKIPNTLKSAVLYAHRC